MKVKNEKGEEIEVFTEEEVKAREAAAAAAAGSSSPELKKANEDKAAIQKELEELRASGGGGDNHEQQVKRLKDRLDQKDKDIADLNKKFDDQAKAGVEKVVNGGLKDLARGDSELEKRLRYEFENYRPHDTSDAGIKERLEKANMIVRGSMPKPGFMDGGSGAGTRGAGGGPTGGGQQALEGNAALIGGVLGVKAEDLETKKKFEEGRAAGRF